MGLRQILQPRDSDELRALPYVIKELKAQNQQNVEVKQRPPRVYEVPPEWTLCIAVFFTTYLSTVLLR